MGCGGRGPVGTEPLTQPGVGPRRGETHVPVQQFEVGLVPLTKYWNTVHPPSLQHAARHAAAEAFPDTVGANPEHVAAFVVLNWEQSGGGNGGPGGVGGGEGGDGGESGARENLHA